MKKDLKIGDAICLYGKQFIVVESAPDKQVVRHGNTRLVRHRYPNNPNRWYRWMNPENFK